MASAEISQTFYPDGAPESLTMRVVCDVIDSPETVHTAIREAAVLWQIADTELD